MRPFFMYRMYGITQGAMDGGAYMVRMYGIAQGAMDGGVHTPMDGPYNARSHGWRCAYVRYSAMQEPSRFTILSNKIPQNI